MSTTELSGPVRAAYDELTARLRRLSTIDSVAQLLGWDEQVNLPTGAGTMRADQHAVIADIAHESASAPRLGELLRTLEEASSSLGPDPTAVVRQARRDYDRATRLPHDFVVEKAAQSSRGYHAWAGARAANDFARYAPVLGANLDLAKREAAYLGRGDAPYDVMLDIHDPGLTAAAVERLFTELRRELVPFVQAVTSSKVRPRAGVLRGFPVEGQRAMLREVTERIGFDYSRGRIDVSLHPFCSGMGDDVRMTTRYNEDEPLDSLFSSIHESGHGMYEQGLPIAHAGTALGIHAGMAVHESQSRLWENQVARSRGFWKYFEPRLRALFPSQTAAVSSDELYLAINEVAPTSIRVDSDEVTYNLHVVLRFEIERRLFSGELAVADLPAAWTALSRELLGLVPQNDSRGVLQDVHWSGGAFGYFPSYTIGNMIAAQLWYRILAERPRIEDDFAKGEFGWLLGWLREHIHAQGRRYDALGLVRRVTGEELSPAPLVRYLRERYGPLYL
jgi:carboxypeptidase Taq